MAVTPYQIAFTREELLRLH